MKPIKNYQCEMCGSNEKCIWDDEEKERAERELQENFQMNSTDNDVAIICDDCYKIVLLSLNEFKLWLYENQNDFKITTLGIHQIMNRHGNKFIARLRELAPKIYNKFKADTRKKKIKNLI